MSTAAYADLMFAWAAGRLGDRALAAEWRAPAVTTLTTTGDPVHAWLGSAFAHRIDEALAGRAHGGDWPAAVLEVHAHSFSPQEDRVHTLGYRYVIDQFRAHYRVLEPDFLPNPYNPWMKWGRDAYRPLDRLRAIPEDAGQDGISRELLNSLTATAAAGRLTPRLMALRMAASWARHLDAATTERVLAEAADLLGQFSVSPPPDSEARDELRWLAETTCFLAVVHRRDDFVCGLAGRLIGWLQTGGPAAGEPVARRLYLNLLDALRRLNLPVEVARLLDAEAVTAGRLSAAFSAAERLQWAGVAWWLDRPGVAEQIYRPARSDLVVPPRDRKKWGEYRHGVVAYIAAVGRGRIAAAGPMLSDFVPAIPRMRAGFTTDTHYSRTHLDIVEAVILALATDDFSPVPALHARLGPDEVAGRRELLPRLRDAVHAWGRDDWNCGAAG